MSPEKRTSTAPLTGTEIAVIGMACRLPGAADLAAFWHNLRHGVESIRTFSDSELAAAGEPTALIADPDYVRSRPVLDGIDLFDAGFFGLSPQDAAITDPQHRLFLEVGWQALEHAGYDAARFPGNIGVFASCGMNSYMMYHLVTNQRIMQTVGEWLVRHTGNDMNFLATRLSYELDLKGPSLNVQTACSSALVGIHLACQSLLNGECDMAMAGGSVIVLPQDRGYLYKPGEILAPDGHCRAFDARAQGTTFGSGAGLVVLRRLADALDQGDQILAVIKGSAVNNDGASKVGYLAPSVEGQSRAVLEALTVSGVDADTISYVEAHGTGTLVGDPIEITALTEAFRRHTARTAFCSIGSLKSNIGHLGEAAGVAAIIKTVLSLQHREIPPSLHFHTPNPQIDFANSPFSVNAVLRDWNAGATPRRAGITALGAGGTNCHVVVEEAPERDPTDRSDEAQLLVLSAKTAAALDAATVNLAAHFESRPDSNLADAAYTLQVGRKVFTHRRALVCRTTREASDILTSGAGATTASGSLRPLRIAFLFPGGGAQYPNMGLGIYRHAPLFRREVDRCLDLLQRKHAIDLRPLLFPPNGTTSTAADLARSTNSILSVFVIEYALSRLWMSWNIVPTALTGHSLGEYTAACLAGVFSLEDALDLIKTRGDIFEQLPEGAMLSVSLPEAEVRPLLDGQLAIAAVNAPRLCVVSGTVGEIDALEQTLASGAVETQRVQIAVAAHSAMLDPYLDEFAERLTRVALSPPTIPFISNLTGQWIRPEDATDPCYWVRHLRGTVRFSDGLATLLQAPDQVLLEVGPGRNLTTLARQQSAKPVGAVTSLRHPQEDVPDLSLLLTTLGRLWTLGLTPDWSALHGSRRRRRVALPSYPFERQRYWIEPAPAMPAPTVAPSVEAPSGIDGWFSAPAWKRTPPPLAVTDSGPVLIFVDDEGLGKDLADRFRAGPASNGEPPPLVYLVERGHRFQRLGSDRFTVHPGTANDYLALFSALRQDSTTIRHIVHCWNVGGDRVDDQHVDGQLAAAFFSPLYLAQAIGCEEPNQSVSLTFLSSGLHQISGESTVQPVKATLLGPCRVIPRELPRVISRSVDVVVARSGWLRERLVDQLALELRSDATESVVAYRGADRWTQQFEPVRIHAATSQVYRDHGVYLITGGLGALGLAMAEHLAASVNAKLILVSRTRLPPRQAWDGWVAAHSESDRTTRQILTIRRCEALGAEVMVCAADVTSIETMRTVLRQARDRFGSLHGVFHAAGALDDGVLQLKTDDSALRVLRPKVHGTLVLDVLLRDQPLDFIVLFSSVSAVLGLQGQVDYTAANAFLDAYAHRASHTGSTRVVAIDWGAWKDAGLAAGASLGRLAITGGRAAAPLHPWIERSRISSAGDRCFTASFNRDRDWVIGEHVIEGAEALLPGTGFLELARAALAEQPQTGVVEMSSVFFQSPFVVRAGETRALEIALEPSGTAYDLTVKSESGVHLTGRIGYVDAAPAPRVDLEAIRSRCRTPEDAPGGFLRQDFMALGPRWGSIAQIDYGDGEALLGLTLPADFTDDLRHCRLHPALFDVATGASQRLIPGFDQSLDFYVPFSYGRVRQFSDLPPVFHSHVRLRSASHGTVFFDATLLSETGDVLVEVSDFCMKRVADRHLLVQQQGQASAVSALGGRAPQSAAALADDMLRSGMTRDGGLAALDRIVTSWLGPQIVVSTVDLTDWRTRIDAVTEASRRSRPTASTGRIAGSALAAGDIEARLADIWSELLGVEAIALDDNFFELGGHSLLAVRLLRRIEKTFHKSIALQGLFEPGTVQSLAALIRGDQQERHRPRVIVPLIEEEQGPTFFCVHSLGGDVISLRTLANALGPGQRLFGFQAPLDDDFGAATSVESLAARYVRELIEFQPEGPYLIGGWSAGAIIAYEMAQQLQRQGHRVELLVALDGAPLNSGAERKIWNPIYGLKLLRNLPYFVADDLMDNFSVTAIAQRFRYKAVALARTGAARLLGREEPRAAQIAGFLDASLWSRREQEFMRRLYDATTRYVAEPYAGRVVLYQSRTEPLYHLFEVDRVWRRLAVDVTIVPVGGTHLSLIREPHVRGLAADLRKRIADAWTAGPRA